MSKNKLIAIAAGGTGGHIFPAQSLAELLIKEGYEVVLICDDRANQFLQGVFNDIEKYYIISEKHTSSKLRKVASYTKLFLSILKVRSYLKNKKPSLVIGFGGYPTFPSLAAALSLKIKVAVHEQNAVLGMVNRFFAPFVDRLFISFSPTLKLKEQHLGKAIIAGSMVRSQIKKAKKDADKFLRILVIGGSQGAQVMTDFVPDALISLPKDLQKRIVVHQQARDNLIEETNTKYSDFLGKVQISEFFTDIGTLMNQADLVICRAGASTIAEVTTLGKAAIFIPYPHAVDNHQYYNALNLVDRGAGTMIVQEDLTKKSLADKIEKLLAHEEYRLDIEHNAQALADKELSKKFLHEVKNLLK